MSTENTVSAESRKSVICRGERFELYIDRDAIQKRVREIGAELSRDLEGKVPIFIGVLNGSFMFLADLMRSVEIDCEVDFWKLSSYGVEKVTSGEVKELKRVDADLRGRHVIVVEDIVDTGLSIEYVVARIQEYGPASLQVVTLLHKIEATETKVTLDYVGFRIPNRFVIGYGLDYGQLARNLPEIYIRAEQDDDED